MANWSPPLVRKTSGRRGVAQLVEHAPPKRGVAGSSPVAPAPQKRRRPALGGLSSRLALRLVLPRAAAPPRTPLRGARARARARSPSTPRSKVAAHGSSRSPPRRSRCGWATSRDVRSIAARLRSPPSRGVFSCRGCCGSDPGALAGVPEDEGPGASRPADPDLRAAREVRGRPGGSEPARRTSTSRTSSRTGSSG